jgi:hypothetical protein
MTSRETLLYILQNFDLDDMMDTECRPYDDVKRKPLREIRLNNFTRIDLAILFAELKYTKGVEIGVERGLYSEVLLQANSNLLLYLVDPLKAYKGYREHVTQAKMDGFYLETKERLKKYVGGKRSYVFFREYSMEIVHDVPDNSLDFVYIDGNHDFQNTTNDIAEWSKKVRKGGIISGHDYNRNKKKDYNCHVKDVVQGWTYAYDIHPYFITSDKSPSWFWVKT